MASSSSTADFQVMSSETPREDFSSVSITFDTHEKRQAGGCVAAFLSPSRNTEINLSNKEEGEQHFHSFCWFKDDTAFFKHYFSVVSSQCCAGVKQLVIHRTVRSHEQG